MDISTLQRLVDSTSDGSDLDKNNLKCFNYIEALESTLRNTRKDLRLKTIAHLHSTLQVNNAWVADSLNDMIRRLGSKQRFQVCTFEWHRVRVCK